jgi:hypothetical protein
MAKLCITIQDRIAVRTRSRKCFSQLLHYPGAGWVFRDVEMEDPASTVFDDEETVQDSKIERRHGEEVHGGDDFAVIVQESSPEFPWLHGRKQSPDIARNRAFRDVKAEFEKFTMNPRSAPGGILFHHPPDESANLGIDLWSARALWARAQAPEQPKASPMPGDNGFWSNEGQRRPTRQPRRKKPVVFFD